MARKRSGNAPTAPDVVVDWHGSIVIVRPKTPEARAWIGQHVSDDCQYWCGGVVVEPRYLDDLVVGMQADGLTVV